jgi:hypothetical protein
MAPFARGYADIPAFLQMTAHSASVTGQTDSRDWRISAMPESSGVAFISVKVTGVLTGITGATSMRPKCSLGSLGFG